MPYTHAARQPGQQCHQQSTEETRQNGNRPLRRHGLPRCATDGPAPAIHWRDRLPPPRTRAPPAAQGPSVAVAAVPLDDGEHERGQRRERDGECACDLTPCRRSSRSTCARSHASGTNTARPAATTSSPAMMICSRASPSLPTKTSGFAYTKDQSLRAWRVRSVGRAQRKPRGIEAEAVRAARARPAPAPRRARGVRRARTRAADAAPAARGRRPRPSRATPPRGCATSPVEAREAHVPQRRRERAADSAW